MKQSEENAQLERRIGYVLKVYPRLSQTFVLSEILEHEAANLPLEIFSLRLPDDGQFHESLARVRSPVTYIKKPTGKAIEFWHELQLTADVFPEFWKTLDSSRFEISSEVQQAVMLAREIKARNVVHLHAHFGTIATTVARLAADIAGITYSMTAHAKDIFHESIDQAHLGKKLSDASTVVTVSRFNIDYLTDAFGKSAGNLKLVYNGLDLNKFPYKPPATRERLILGVGRLVEKKGFEYLVEACDILNRSGEKFRCEIIGAGALADALRDRIRDLGLEDSVELLGAMPQDAVRDKIREAAMLVAPCVVASDGDRDGLPTVLLESMALGTPCVSTDVTGIPEILIHEQTGLATAQRDPQELAEACRRLLNDDRLRVALAKAGRALIEEDFDIRKNTRELRKVFGKAAGTDTSYPFVGNLRHAEAAS